MVLGLVLLTMVLGDEIIGLLEFSQKFRVLTSYIGK